MSKLKKLLTRFLSILLESVQRFPEAIVISIAFVVVMIVNNRANNDPNNIYRDLGMILGLGIPIAVCMKLLIERLSLSNVYRVVSVVGLGAYIGLFLRWIPEDFNDRFTFRYIAATAIAYVLFTLIPYAFSRKGYGKYLIKIITSFLITYLYTFVLYFGIIAIIFAIDQLFSVEIAEEIYFDLFIASVGVFGLTYYLGKVPKLEDDLSNYVYPKILKVLFVSIVIPLISIYTMVLLVYFVNIAFVQVWPKGIIALLVLWYGFISTILLMVIEPLKDQSKLVAVFRKYYPIATLVPFGTLFAGLIVRINAYGLTVNRLLVMVAWLWFVVVVLYLIVSQKQKHQLISLAFLGIVLIAFFAPINVFSITVNNQLKHLHANIEAHGLLVGDKIIAQSDLEDSVEITIGSQLKLLEAYKALEQVEGLSSDFELEDMKEVFGFDYKGAYYYREFGQIYVSYHSNLDKAVDISSYDYHRYFNEYEGIEDHELLNKLDLPGLLEENDIELNYSYQEDTEPIELLTVYEGNEALLIIESIEGIIEDEVLVINRIVGHIYY